MSLHEYLTSNAINQLDPPFYALIMAAMRKADNTNLGKLREVFPEVWEELDRRYHAGGGVLPEDGIELDSIGGIEIDAGGGLRYVKDKDDEEL